MLVRIAIGAAALVAVMAALPPTLASAPKAAATTGRAIRQLTPGKTHALTTTPAFDWAAKWGTMGTLLSRPYHYSLYVPRTLPTKGNIVAVIHSSPNGNARPLSIPDAERRGWLMVGLTESRNGPWSPIQASRDAVIVDLRRRLNIRDRRLRLIFAGFSGGARASGYAGVECGEDTEALLCMGASFRGYPRLPEVPRRVPVAFICGSGDPNRREVQECLKVEKKAGRDCTYFEFAGGHTPPPPALLQQALKWISDHRARPLPIPPTFASGSVRFRVQPMPHLGPVVGKFPHTDLTTSYNQYIQLLFPDEVAVDRDGKVLISRKNVREGAAFKGEWRVNGNQLKDADLVRAGGQLYSLWSYQPWKQLDAVGALESPYRPDYVCRATPPLDASTVAIWRKQRGKPYLAPTYDVFVAGKQLLSGVDLAAYTGDLKTVLSTFKGRGYVPGWTRLQREGEVREVGMGANCLALSRDGGHYAFEQAGDGKNWIVVDGTPGEKYDDVHLIGFTESLDGEEPKVVFLARRDGNDLFGIGSRLFPFTGQLRHRSYSPDGSRFMLLVGLHAVGKGPIGDEEHPKTYRVVGENGSIYFSDKPAAEAFEVSPDCRRFLLLHRDGTGVLDGKPFPYPLNHLRSRSRRWSNSYAGGLKYGAFSPNSRHWAVVIDHHRAAKFDEMSIVCEKGETQRHHAIWFLQVSDEGDVYAAAARDGAWRLVVNGSESEPFDVIFPSLRQPGEPVYFGVKAGRVYRLTAAVGAR